MATSILAGSPSLWELIDAYLLTLCTTWAAKWTETENAAIYVAEQVNPDTVGYPYILISGYSRSLAEGEPRIGQGVYGLANIRYPYQIAVCAAFDDFVDAKRFAAKASETLMDDLRAEPAFGGLAAANGEIVEGFDFDDGEIYVRGMSGQAGTGLYTGAAIILLEVFTEV